MARAAHFHAANKMDDQSTNREDSGRVKRMTSTSGERFLAGVLSLIYIGGWVLAGYALSIRIEDHWPARVFWVVFATWFAIMLALPLVAVCWFVSGVAASPAWFRARVSLRALLIVMTLIAITFGVIVWATEFFSSPTT